MKKYYIHDGTNQEGAFDLDELKTKQIIKDTMIWYEGLETWKKAGEIPELKSLFPITPPVYIKAETPVPPQPIVSNVGGKSIIRKYINWEIRRRKKLSAFYENLFGGVFSFGTMNQEASPSDLTNKSPKEPLFKKILVVALVISAFFLVFKAKEANDKYSDPEWLSNYHSTKAEIKQVKFEIDSLKEHYSEDGSSR